MTIAATSSETQERVRIQIAGGKAEATLLYLPGLHGDWSLISGFRKAIGDRARFVEVSYPDTVSWTLADHAAAVEAALSEAGISHAWLLGESFSSQVVWSLLERRRFPVDGVILAGGFVRHPARWAANLCARVLDRIPVAVLRWLLQGYAAFGPWRFRGDLQTVAGIRNYVDRFTDEKRQAARHRLQLIAQNDPCAAAVRAGLPLFALAGFWDPIVPWLGVRSWLRRHCPALREFKILWNADHNVLGTAPATAAGLVLDWMKALQPRK